MNPFRISHALAMFSVLSGSSQIAFSHEQFSIAVFDPQSKAKINGLVFKRALTTPEYANIECTSTKWKSDRTGIRLKTPKPFTGANAFSEFYKRETFLKMLRETTLEQYVFRYETVSSPSPFPDVPIFLVPFVMLNAYVRGTVNSIGAIAGSAKIRAEFQANTAWAEKFAKKLYAAKRDRKEYTLPANKAGYLQAFCNLVKTAYYEFYLRFSDSPTYPTLGDNPAVNFYQSVDLSDAEEMVF